MKHAFLAIALVLLAGSVFALNISAPSEVAAGSSFAAKIDFDSLDSFSEANILVNGGTAAELETVGNSRIYVKSVDNSRILNLKEGETIENSTIYVLIAGAAAEGTVTIRVEEAGKDSREASVTIFSAVSSTEVETMKGDVADTRDLVISYTSDLDELQNSVNTLQDMVSAGEASKAELSTKVSEIASQLSALESSSETGLQELTAEIGTLSNVIEAQQDRIDFMQAEAESAPTGLFGLAAIQDPQVLGALLVIIIAAALVFLYSKGKIKMPAMPKFKTRRKTIYAPDDSDKEITSQVLEEAAGSDKSAGKWAFKGSGWKPKQEEPERLGGLGNLIKRD